MPTAQFGLLQTVLCGEMAGALARLRKVPRVPLVSASWSSSADVHVVVQEFKTLVGEPNKPGLEGVSVALVGDDAFKWQATLDGKLIGEPYADGVFYMSLEVIRLWFCPVKRRARSRSFRCAVPQELSVFAAQEQAGDQDLSHGHQRQGRAGTRLALPCPVLGASVLAGWLLSTVLHV